MMDVEGKGLLEDFTPIPDKGRPGRMLVLLEGVLEGKLIFGLCHDTRS